MNPWIIAGPTTGFYIAGWLIAARCAFNHFQGEYPNIADDDIGLDGAMSLLVGLLWPLLFVLAPFVLPWWFVTAPARKRIRKRKNAAKTADLEYEIYGRRPLG